MKPDGMPLIATEILLSAGAGWNLSAIGTGADAELTSQPAPRLAGALEPMAVVVCPASDVLLEQAASEIAATTLAIVIVSRFARVACMSVAFSSGSRAAGMLHHGQCR
jgi:hypothetical protein